MEPYIAELEERLREDPVLSVQYPVRWFAIKLLENDEGAAELLAGSHPDAERVMALAESCRDRFKEENGKGAERHIAFTRHGFVRQHCGADCGPSQGTTSGPCPTSPTGTCATGSSGRSSWSPS